MKKLFNISESPRQGRIGIELDNDGFEPFSDQLMSPLISLFGCIGEPHNIPVNMVQGHSDVAVGRKVDPNPYFSWQKLAEDGIGIFPVVEADHTILFKPGETSTAFGVVQSSLKIQGYKIEVTNTFDTQSSTVIQAFKRRFIPEAFKLEEVQGGKKDWVYVNQNWDEQANGILKQLLKEATSLEAENVLKVEVHLCSEIQEMAHDSKGESYPPSQAQ